MDHRLAEGLDRTMKLAGNALLARVERDTTLDAQKRKEAEQRANPQTPTLEEPGYGHGV